MNSQLTRTQANIIAFIIERSTQSGWQFLRDEILDAGYKAKEVIEATKRLCEIAGMSNIFCEDDF